MSVKQIIIRLVSIVLLSATIQAVAQEPTAARKPGVIELRQQLNESYASKDYVGFLSAARKLNKLRPNNSEYMYQVVLAYALLDDKPGAYDMMLEMQQQGLSYDFDATTDTENIRGTEAYDHIAELLRVQGDPVGTLSAQRQLPEIVQIPTAVTWDSERQAALLGTARDGLVVSVNADNETEVLLKAEDYAGMWGIYGIQADPERNRLWLSTGANTKFQGYDPIDKGRSALFEFKLDTLEFVKRYPVPVDGRPHRLGQIALAPNGDLFLADEILPIVYLLQVGADRMQPYMAASELVSLRGITVSADGKKLYIADYEMGIVMVDLESEQIYQVKSDTKLNLGGIEGLYSWNQHLVIIQNNIRPQRILRLDMDEFGTKVTGLAPVAVALPEFDFPSYGVMVGEQLYFLASSHWGNDPAAFKPVTAAEISVGDLPVMESPDMQKFRRQVEARQLELDAEAAAAAAADGD